MHNVRDTPLEDLSLRAAIPSAERDGVALAFEYIQWLVSQRHISVRTEGLVIRSIMAAAKHLHHDKSKVCRPLLICRSTAVTSSPSACWFCTTVFDTDVVVS